MSNTTSATNRNVDDARPWPQSEDPGPIPEFLRRKQLTSEQQAKEQTRIARPLRVLAPLIAEDLQHGDEAAKQASVPYYRAAGEKLLEVKAQLEHGEFTAWVKRNFRLSARLARYYMSLARATDDPQNGTAVPFRTLNEFRQKHLGENRRRISGNKVNSETLNRWREDWKSRLGEREAETKLALQLVSIGYKALAAKLHPDKGGSQEAMTRLNRVRDRLKANA